MDDAIFASAGYLISLAARSFARLSDARLKPLGIGAGQVPVMVALSNGIANTQRDLARLTKVEQPPMAQMLARMERSGIIARTADPADARSSLIALTDSGQQRIPDAYNFVMDGNQEALRGFSDCERKLFIEFLKRLNANLDAMLVSAA
jgi:MarR family transcriptional regulator, transcriptional regulator for hemolysin